MNGTTDFNSGEIDMTVQAAPGKHEADGIMPLKLNIGGTVDDPKGSMSMLGSVSSLVTQGIGNNFASRSVKRALADYLAFLKRRKNKPCGLHLAGHALRTDTLCAGLQFVEPPFLLYRALMAKTSVRTVLCLLPAALRFLSRLS